MTQQLSPVCKLPSRNVTKWQSLTFRCWLITQILEPTQKFFGLEWSHQKRRYSKIEFESNWSIICDFNLLACLSIQLTFSKAFLCSVFPFAYLNASVCLCTFNFCYIFCFFVLLYFPSGSEQYVKYAYLCCFSLLLLPDQENIFLFVPGNRRFLKQFCRSRLTVRFCFGRSYSLDENTTIVSI